MIAMSGYTRHIYNPLYPSPSSLPLSLLSHPLSPFSLPLRISTKSISAREDKTFSSSRNTVYSVAEVSADQVCYEST